MFNFSRRVVVLFLSLSAAAAMPATAQTPALIKLVVPYPPGGSVDTMARLLAQPLSDELKTSVVVDNRPGAGGRIAASQLKRDTADGSVILIAPNALTTIQSLTYAGKIDYSVTRDFTPVSRLASYPFGVAVPTNSPAKSVPDLLKAMKANPSVASYGTSGAGGMAHFAAIALGKEAGVDWTHVAFKGGAPLVTDLIGGHIPVGVDTLVDQIEHQRGGKIRILGIFSPHRYALAPEIPTLAEQGLKVAPVEGWFGAFVPARTPKETVARIDAAIAKVIQEKDFKARLNKLMLEPSYLPSQEFTKLQVAELQQWEPVVKASGFTPD
ncbi:Bug family tripartite tricarboxylate transporter substrate binding protein [Variovorax atrisoli]|uniref:Bug family tripartite tricarboxylate transporter substrate binding protein n=1 Tax=Variovorax atrisoli TaxID=3394203 RepID=UPI00161F12FF|nr:tripartite tricarboxylate transporter substrate-binding protein [Variovorax sp. BK613]